MGHNIKQYIKNLECDKQYKNIMTVENRSNNTKRNYLFCNKIQGKHIPTCPSYTFNMLNTLIKKIEEKLDNQKVLVIGFAETATALGAYIGDNLKQSVYYIQTTRENCSPCKKLIEFEEEHSHATEQYLYGDWNSIPNFNYILFVDDEISTGKTIINFIKEFEKIKSGISFGVASICNWQNEENRRVYESRHIDTFCLIRGEVQDANAKMIADIAVSEPEHYAYDCNKIDTSDVKVETLHIGKINPMLLERTGRIPHDTDYMFMVNKAKKVVLTFLGEKRSNVLILGTEEFMYLPLLIAKILDNKGYQVNFHAPSRSSINIMNGSKNIYNELVEKYKLHSVYDNNRTTYVYNLKYNDKVVIITDGKNINQFKNDIVAVLNKHNVNNKDIMILNIKE